MLIWSQLYIVFFADFSFFSFIQEHYCVAYAINDAKVSRM